MSPPIAVVITLILCFEALLFLLFTAIMFCTQIHSISVDETGIEQLKGEKNFGSTNRLANFRAVFGKGPYLYWLLPLGFQYMIIRSKTFLYLIGRLSVNLRHSSIESHNIQGIALKSVIIILTL